MNLRGKKGTFSVFGFEFRDDFRVILPTLSKKGLILRAFN